MIKGAAKLRPDDDPTLTKVCLDLSRGESSFTDTYV